MMNISSLLSIFQTMLETAVIIRAQFVAARAYGDTEGMIQALQTAISIDEDTTALLKNTLFQPLELSGKQKKISGTPEEIVELMRTMMRLESANITSMLKTIPGELPELEERRHEAVTRKMISVGNYFRTLKRALKEHWHFWNSSYEREFSSMLRLRASRKKKK